MNKNLLFSGFISLIFHISLFFAPLYSLFINPVDIDMIKAPASIEISLVHSIPSVEIKTVKIRETRVDKKEEEARKEEKPKESKIEVPAESAIGAITEQISSLMVNEPPTYPVLARAKGWEGEVVLTANITRDGRVGKVDVLSSSGFSILDRAAQKAIYKWQFRNIKRPIQIEIPVKFVLTRVR